MTWLLSALGILVGSGVLALTAARQPRLSSFLGVVGSCVASVLGLIPAIHVLAGGEVEALSWPWHVPYGSFSIALDALSAFFLVPILLLTALAAVYGASYLRSYEGRKSLGAAWFFYNLLTAGMMLVVLARNGMLFLLAWEIMSLASFFLVTFEDEKAEVRSAGWTYLVATHLGTAFLLALFVILGQHSGGSLDFAKFPGGAALPVGVANVLFVLALVGFGTKAGFLPLHVWLPEAHPVAPSHVSAVMSGVMIKMGIYGLVRTLTYLGPPPVWWAWTLLAIGLTSGILGILLAQAQRDLKRMLAYSSVENIGIIALGLGTGLLGLSTGKPALMILGFAGALLHVVNHALYKGLLFLGAGAVLHASNTADMNRLGGLCKRMPWIGLAFLIGCVAICGLPPGNGFLSKFLIYLAAFQEETGGSIGLAVAGLAVIAGLALISGLAVAGFTKAFGIVFLGEPRSDAARHAHAPDRFLTAPVVALAAGCLLISGSGPWLLPILARVVGGALSLPPAEARLLLEDEASALPAVVYVSGIFLVLVAGLAWLRSRLLQDRPVTVAETWGCGYAQPTARMQYTAASFGQPVVDLFQPVIQSRTEEPRVTEYFPRQAALATEAPEPWRERLYRPVFHGIGWALGKLRWLQHGRVQLYVLYIALTMVLLLMWYLG